MLSRDNPWQRQIKNRPFRIHHAPRQSHHRNHAPFLRIIPKQKHRPRKHRRTIAFYLSSKRLNRPRRTVVRINTHAARTDKQIRSLRQKFPQRADYHFLPVIHNFLPDNLNAIFRKLCAHHRTKRILNAPLKNLASRRHNSCFHPLKRHDFQQRLFPRKHARPFHFLLFNHKRNNARRRNFFPFSHRKVPVHRGNHHLTQRVHRVQPFGMNL